MSELQRWAAQSMQQKSWPDFATRLEQAVLAPLASVPEAYPIEPSDVDIMSGDRLMLPLSASELKVLRGLFVGSSMPTAFPALQDKLDYLDLRTYLNTEVAGQAREQMDIVAKRIRRSP